MAKIFWPDVDWETMILLEQEMRDAYEEQCDSDCRRCPYGTELSADFWGCGLMLEG